MATVSKPKLLASSWTPDGIKECIAKFYCGTVCTFNESGEVVRVSDGKTLPGVRVICRARRYRFESIA